MATPTELYINAELPKRPHTAQYPLTAGHVPVATGVGLEVAARQLDVTDVANAASETYVDNAISNINITPHFSDSDFRLQDNSDSTKQLAFEVSAIPTGSTITLTVPGVNVDLSHMYTGASIFTGPGYTRYRFNRADGLSDQTDIPFPDDGGWYITNTSTPSKKIAFNAANISANQRRVISMPDINVDLGDLPTVATTNSNILSGLNSGIASGVSNTIAGTYSFIGGGISNVISSNFGVIAGGSGNNIYAATTAFYSFIGGGNNNKINFNGYAGTSDYSTIGGGSNNKIDGMYSVICGGQNNTINVAVTDVHSAILGGSGNSITGTTGRRSTIAGGQFNNNAGFASIITCGTSNIITSNGDGSAILSGRANKADAAGQVIICGGDANRIAMQHSTTVGSNATFVPWGGGQIVQQVLHGVTGAAGTIYLDVNGINSTSQLTTSAVPHTALTGATGEYKLGRHEIVIEIATQSFGSIAVGKIISRWKNVNETFTKLGTDTYTVEYEDASIAGIINNMTISNNSGRLQIGAVSASPELTVWRAFVTSYYS